MNSIFFDLETTDKNPIGQIINYSFILVDQDFEIVDELSGLVQISRLQLPSPGAILANRVDVLEHQKLASDNERAAMAKIYQFISRAIESTGGGYKLPIVGYNSSRFDIPYLRTSFIRNGINPYFNGRIVLRDLLFLGRKLVMVEPAFPRAAATGEGKDSGRVSLSLENLCHQFALLSGVQSHESRADVLLTIALAKVYVDRFKADVRNFEPFEALQDQGKPSRGMVRWMMSPEYAVTESRRFVSTPMVLLDFDYRSSLWIDLTRFRDRGDRSSISWFNHSGGHLFVRGEQEPLSPEEQELLNRALILFKDLTLKNFFEPSTCDIEQDIYRLDFDAIGALEAIIWHGKEEALRKCPNRDARVVFMRQQIASAPLDKPLPEKLEMRLAQYAEYRYGGKAQLAKSLPDNDAPAERKKEAFHPTLEELRMEIGRLKETADSQESATLLSSLQQFIDESDIARLLSQ